MYLAYIAFSIKSNFEEPSCTDILNFRLYFSGSVDEVISHPTEFLDPEQNHKKMDREKNSKKMGRKKTARIKKKLFKKNVT